MALRRQGLSQRRKAVGLTQESLAGQLGVERSTVVRWEAGDTEPLPWIRPKLARALHVSIDQLAELLTTSENADTTRAPSADTVEVLRRAPHIAGEDVGLDKPRRFTRFAAAGVLIAGLTGGVAAGLFITFHSSPIPSATAGIPAPATPAAALPAPESGTSNDTSPRSGDATTTVHTAPAAASNKPADDPAAAAAAHSTRTISPSRTTRRSKPSTFTTPHPPPRIPAWVIAARSWQS